MDLKSNEVIIKEVSSYKTLLFRKGMAYRILETVIFILGIIIAFYMIGENNLQFKLSAVAIAALVVGGSPFVYQALLHPTYTLTKTELWISVGQKEQMVPLANISPSYDLRYMYYLNGKKKPLMVSDQFLEVLNQELWRIRHLKKHK